MIRIIFFQPHTLANKTIQMRRMLYGSILIQTICFAIIYAIPLGATLIFVLTGFKYTSSVFLIVLMGLNLYEMASYVILLVSIRYFRDGVKKLFWRLKLKIMKNPVTTVSHFTVY